MNYLAKNIEASNAQNVSDRADVKAMSFKKKTGNFLVNTFTMPLKKIWAVATYLWNTVTRVLEVPFVRFPQIVGGTGEAIGENFKSVKNKSDKWVKRFWKYVWATLKTPVIAVAWVVGWSSAEILKLIWWQRNINANYLENTAQIHRSFLNPKNSNKVRHIALDKSSTTKAGVKKALVDLFVWWWETKTKTKTKAKPVPVPKPNVEPLKDNSPGKREEN